MMATKTPHPNLGTPEDRRLAPRVLVNLEVDFGNADNFLFAYIRDISVTGIFVRTNTPEVPGTRLNLRFAATPDDPPLDVEGEVIWVNPYRPGDRSCLYPGMGIQFIELTDEQLAYIARLIKTFAYLDDEVGEEEVPHDQLV